MKDGQGVKSTTTLKVNITGSNDGPIVTSGPQTGSATERADGAADENTATHSANGTISFSDVDTTDTHSASFTPQAGGYRGTFSLAPVNQAGNSVGWDFSVDDADLDSLADGETLTQIYNVTVSDGSGGTATTAVTITVIGTNDAPIITVPSGEQTVDLGGPELAVERSFGEDDTLTASGTLTVSDVDTDIVNAQVISVSGGGAGYSAADGAGLLTLTTTNPVLDGSETSDALGWSFNDSVHDFNSLPPGFQVRWNYTIRVTDSAGATDDQVVSVVITGTNDAPIIDVPSGEQTVDLGGSELAVERSFGEDDTLSATGTLTVSDVDSGDVVNAQIIGITGGGAGYTAADGAGLLTLTTSNPVLDGSETSDALGWSFNDSIHDFNSLPPGFQVRWNYTIQVTDSSGAVDTQVVSIVITGTNDAPVITSGPHAGSATERPDGAVDENTATHTASGTITYNDVDTADHTASFAPQPGSYIGTFTLDPVNQSGNSVGWNFSVDDADLDALADGETRTQLYDVTVDDGAGGTATTTVTITITGTNDAPIIAIPSGETTTIISGETAVSRSLAETDAPVTTSGVLDVSDVDTDIVNAQIISVTGGGAGYTAAQGAGLLTLTTTNPVLDGSETSGSLGWTFDSESFTFDDLPPGHQVRWTYTIQVTDSAGATDTQLVTILITGTNDGPVASADSTTIDEDGTVTDVAPGVLENDDDVDGGTLSVTAVNGNGGNVGNAVVGTYGTLTLNADGSYSYTADQAAADAIAQRSGVRPGGGIQPDL
jgi:VCBS repeat-containing protein